MRERLGQRAAAALSAAFGQRAPGLVGTLPYR
jgi:hypothetical protein